jgi:required for meiotic nuclear division protein 1
MRIPYKAWYFHGTIDEGQVRKRLSDFTIETEDPLVVRVDEQYRALVSSFGAVVFWPFHEETARMLTARISQTLHNPRVVEEVEDRLTVETGKSEVRFFHNEIWLTGETNPVQLRVIAMLLAQSVALDYLEHEADEALQGSSEYLQNLREHGRIRISGKRILKSIGYAMQTRHAVLTNLALFDKPPETWESEAIEVLYQGLHDFFDLPERQEVMNAKLSFMSENTAMLFEVLSARKSQYLEWIIIILIAAEIVGFSLYEFLR